jgi:hypothetical protein
MMRTGFKSGYWVVEWADEFDPNLADFVPRLPEIVQGRRVAIAACDSGPFEPTQTEYDMGWLKKNGLAISPVIEVATVLPMPGFDEWYVYDGKVPDVKHECFVNRFGFAPLDAVELETQAFWAQVERLQPLHVIGAGTPCMFFVTKDEVIFRKVSSFK